MRTPRSAKARLISVIRAAGSIPYAGVRSAVNRASGRVINSPEKYSK